MTARCSESIVFIPVVDWVKLGVIHAAVSPFVFVQSAVLSVNVCIFGVTYHKIVLIFFGKKCSPPTSHPRITPPLPHQDIGGSLNTASPDSELHDCQANYALPRNEPSVHDRMERVVHEKDHGHVAISITRRRAHVWDERKHAWEVDDDDDDDTQRSPSNSRWRPGPRGVSVGVITPRNKVCENWCSLLCWQGLYLHTVKMTVCSTSDRLEKHMGKRNTGCCWYKIL